MLAAFALSKMTLDAIRDGTLKHAENDDFVFSIGVQDYFVALLRSLEERWLQDGLIIIKFHSTLDEIAAESRKSVRAFVSKYA
jgi:hypothetical protein